MTAAQLPATLLAHYAERTARAWDSRTLATIHWRATGAAHALLACGLLTADEHAAGMQRIADAIANRAAELATDLGESEERCFPEHEAQKPLTGGAL